MIYRQNFTFYQKKTGFTSFVRRAAFLFVTSLTWLLLSFSLVQGAEKLRLTQVHDTVFPDERLPTNEGDGFVLSEHEGALLVNFWASWCAPCVAELPLLAQAARAFDAQGAGIEVVLISVDRKGADHAQDFLDKKHIRDVISAYNPSSSWPRALGLQGLPSTYLISADRSSIYLLYGPAHWSDEAVMAQVTQLIGKK